MKKSLILFLSLLFLFNCTGMGLIWLSRIQDHREAVHSGKKHGPRVTLQLDDNSENRNRFVSGKEFESDEKRYDIISVSRSNGKLILVCYDDTKESRMFTELEKQNDSQQSEKQKNHSKKSGTDYFCSVVPSLVFIFTSTENITGPAEISSSVPRSVPAPPPWFV